MHGFIGVAFAVAVAAFILLVARILRAGTPAPKPTGSSGDEPQISDLHVSLGRAPQTTPLGQVLRPLATVDPGFSAQAFLPAAQAAIVDLVAHDFVADPHSRPVTQTLMGQLPALQATWSSAGLPAKGQEFAIAHAWIVGVSVDEQRQSITTVFDGSFGQSAGARMQAGFVRPSGATTKPGSALIASSAVTHCQACGAEVSPGISACPFCGARLDQSGAPWLIDTIDLLPAATAQPNVQTPARTGLAVGLLMTAKSPGSAPVKFAFGKDAQAGLDLVHAKDAEFSRDRFLRWATQTYLERQRSAGKPVALQKADILGFADTGEKQYLLVSFSSMSGKVHKVEVGVFSRASTAQTPPPPVAAANQTCANCGAPLEPGDAACRFCGTVLPDVSGGWSLDQVSDKGPVAFSDIQQV
jgi:predicted lipid-binding transport protein (Tim44 family)